MKVKARTNIKYDGTWRFAGAVFEIRDEELKELIGMVEVQGELKTPAPKPSESEKRFREESRSGIQDTSGDAEAAVAQAEKKPAAKTTTRKRKTAE